MAEFSPSSDEPQASLMTSSYHEISETEKLYGNDATSDLDLSLPGARKLFEKARNWVGDLSLEGIVSQEGQQVTYVAQDITEKIKLASPVKSVQDRNVNNSQGSAQTVTSNDLNVIINEVEAEAKRLASSVDSLTENLTGVLHSISSMTVDCTFVASDGVTQLCDTADASIKVMYQVMAKSEELNKAVQPVYRLHQQIKETKRLLDRVEAEVG